MSDFPVKNAFPMNITQTLLLQSIFSLVYEYESGSVSQLEIRWQKLTPHVDCHRWTNRLQQRAFEVLLVLFRIALVVTVVARGH
jgi:hypothetical protein